MTRTEFIKEVATVTGKSQRETREFLDAMQGIVYAEMQKGEEVKVFDSVALLGKEVPERVARNPQTGDEIIVPQHLAPKAKFGKVIKELLKA